MIQRGFRVFVHQLTRGDQMARRDALRDQIFYDRNGARCRQFPVRQKLRAGDRTDVGMAVDPQYPGDFARDLLVEVDQRGRELVEFGAALRLQRGLADVDSRGLRVRRTYHLTANG